MREPGVELFKREHSAKCGIGAQVPYLELEGDGP